MPASIFEASRVKPLQFKPNFRVSRAINLSISESDVVARCVAERVGISAIEPLPQGGVRLVCMSTQGADQIRRKLKSHIIKGEVVRHRHRPNRPMW